MAALFLDHVQLAHVSQLSERTVSRHLHRLKIAETIGGRLMVSRYRLRDRWPSMWDALAQWDALAHPTTTEPLYIEAADIVRVSEMHKCTVHRHLRKLEIDEVIGGKVMISRYRLRERWETIAEALEIAAEKGELARPARPAPVPPPPRSREVRARVASQRGEATRRRGRAPVASSKQASHGVAQKFAA